MNIRAVYRKGIGTPGMVAAGQLSQPLDRPQGLKSATNPDAAAGGADPDTADAARVSAPLHVLTLDRVVSLEDYLNYARAFPGIAKALTTWTWFGNTRGMFLTVAGTNGATFEAGDETIVNLAKAVAGAGNPFVPLTIDSYVPVLFEVAATVRIDTTDYDPAEVLGRVWQALAAAFSFSAREMGQGAVQSEVVAVIQQTAGVVAVQLTAFQRSGDAPVNPLPAVLRAASPVIGGTGVPTPAEMLLLDPASQGNIGAWS
jgi:predicted phage baseplate assembly protein